MAFYRYCKNIQLIEAQMACRRSREHPGKTCAIVNHLNKILVSFKVLKIQKSIHLNYNPLSLFSPRII